MRRAEIPAAAPFFSPGVGIDAVFPPPYPSPVPRVVPLLFSVLTLAAGLLLTGCGVGGPHAIHWTGAFRPVPAEVGRAKLAESQPRPVRRTRDVVFAHAGGPDALKADFWVPQGAADAPAILLLHGGGWKLGDLRWTMNRIARDLSEQGFVVMNATYRQLPRWNYPAPLEDVALALNYLRDHAGDYGADPQRIGLWGYSAGGHLASLLGNFEGSGPQGVRAVVAGGTPQDLRAFPDHRLVKAFLGGPYERFPERWEHASPVTHAGAWSPPTFFYHGTKDDIVTPLNAMEGKEVLDRSGVENELLWLRRRGHVGAWRLRAEERALVIDFLRRHLGD